MKWKVLLKATETILQFFSNYLAIVAFKEKKLVIDNFSQRTKISVDMNKVLYHSIFIPDSPIQMFLTKSSNY